MTTRRQLLIGLAAVPIAAIAAALPPTQSAFAGMTVMLNNRGWHFNEQGVTMVHNRDLSALLRQLREIGCGYGVHYEPHPGRPWTRVVLVL